MATLVNFPFEWDDKIETDVDFQKLIFYFYEDEEETTPSDFSLSTFGGEVLDKPGGTKLFDLTFNTPANDGKIAPSLTLAQATTLTGQTVHYFVTVTDSGIKLPYWSGKLKISQNFKPGA